MEKSKEPFINNTFKLASPKPNKKLNKGPAKVPVMAMAPNPFHAIAKAAIVSPAQLPIANTVIPRNGVGIPIMSPSTLKMSTRILAQKYIQTMLMTNDIKMKTR